MKKIIKDEKFGYNIQRIRLSCGLTQEQTVAQLQVLGSPLSRSTYSLIELGKGNVFVSDLVGLQKIFNVDYSAFFEGIAISRNNSKA
ncbi:MAG: helix-turn-helix domain-containing protein [Hungatella sp.]|jgi:transcriptional regulator with XRE-family HTH domain|nr:helix-turn-helix domain-containing protein [Hungatella sp.]